VPPPHGQDLETALYHRLHPPSTMPPRMYDASALGYAPPDKKSGDTQSSHFARVPLQKVLIIYLMLDLTVTLPILEIGIKSTRCKARSCHPTIRST
jgi:hypothetical protein